jgi:hypothetical protein
MAVFCGVCGTRLSNAAENGGSFAVHPSFLGEDGRISDSCEDCANLLKAATTAAANKIVLRVRARELARQERKEREQKAKDDKARKRREAAEEAAALKERLKEAEKVIDVFGWVAQGDSVSKNKLEHARAALAKYKLEKGEPS